MIKTFILQAAALTVSFGCSAATLRPGPWPGGSDCAKCTRLQVWKLELQLPPEIIHGIFSLGPDSGGLGFLPPSGDLGKITYIFKRRFEKSPDLSVRRRFVKAHAIESAGEYFSTLGREPSANDKDLQILRMSTGIDAGTSFTRMEKKPLTAFVLDSTDPNNRRIWIVSEGDEIYYEFNGPMTPPLVEAILTNARPAHLR